MVSVSSPVRPDPLAPIRDRVADDPAAAAAELRRLLDDDPLNAEGYRLLISALEKSSAGAGTVGSVGAGAAGANLRAGQALAAGDLETAERILRPRLLQQPADAESLRLLADLAYQLAFQEEAEALLGLALELAPGMTVARLDLARQLQQRNRLAEAMNLTEEELGRDPQNERALYLKAVILGHLTRFEEACAIYEQLLRKTPGRARLWASLGRSLKTIGRGDEAIAAFRKAIELEPELGEAWWSLSDLKTARLDRGDIAQMETLLSARGLPVKDRYYLHFALGKAYEDQKEAEPSFRHYAEGNQLRRHELGHEPDKFSAFVKASVATFTPAFFADRAGSGSPARDPIFILGMTRAGSTLVEQILASHAEIEGTVELPNMLAIARELAPELEDRVPAIAGLNPDQLRRLGERYVEETREIRKTDKPFFIDKMPNNWLYVPLIHLVLPNARIIDARRHPLACCFSNFKQNYARGQAFSYDLEHLGRYYRDYVRLMAHVDAVLPGRVHRLIHERLVEDTEAEVRALLDYLELPFDPACLRFHENKRAVRTASAEQVRQPINRKGMDVWQAYEPWLGPLKQALGPVLERYPDVPDFPS